MSLSVDFSLTQKQGDFWVKMFSSRDLFIGSVLFCNVSTLISNFNIFDDTFAL